MLVYEMLWHRAQLLLRALWILNRLLLKQLEVKAPETYKEFSSHVDQTDMMNAAWFEALKSESSFE